MAYTGDSVLGLSLNVQTPKPLDVRTVVSDLDELYSINPTYAYQGMTEAVISTGNLYMLIDKNKINDKAGWKASYEAIQIIACTQDEYKEWESNTTEDYAPIDQSKSYLYENTYYYIYEDSIKETDKEQYYVRYGDFLKWESTLKGKASQVDFENLQKYAVGIKTSLEEYTTTEDLEKNYVNNTTLTERFSTELENYHTKDYVDSTFVTLESLKGETTETDYIFVTQSQYKEDQDKIKSEYEEDKQNILTTLDSTLKTEEDGSVKNLTVEQITASSENLVVDTKELYIGSEKAAVVSEVPVFRAMEQSQYEQLVESGQIEEGVYYCTYSDEQKDGIVTNSMLETSYYTKAQVSTVVYNAIKPLLQRIAVLEGASAYLDLGKLDEMTLG